MDISSDGVNPIQAMSGETPPGGHKIVDIGQTIINYPQCCHEWVHTNHQT